jgi:hypothetical protein
MPLPPVTWFSTLPSLVDPGDGDPHRSGHGRGPDQSGEMASTISPEAETGPDEGLQVKPMYSARCWPVMVERAATRSGGVPSNTTRPPPCPGSERSPAQATCPSGRINTAGGAATSPRTGSSHTPSCLASTNRTRFAQGESRNRRVQPRLRSTGRASCSRVNTRVGPSAVCRSRSGMRRPSSGCPSPRS